MKNQKVVIIAVLLLISIVNFGRLVGNETLRPIQFVSIFVIGALTSLLVNELITLFRAKQ